MKLNKNINEYELFNGYYISTFLIRKNLYKNWNIKELFSKTTLTMKLFLCHSKIAFVLVNL